MWNERALRSVYCPFYDLAEGGSVLKTGTGKQVLIPRKGGPAGMCARYSGILTPPGLATNWTAPFSGQASTHEKPCLARPGPQRRA